MKLDFDEKNVILNSKSTKLKEIFLEVAQRGSEIGCVTNVDTVVEGFKEREREGSTGLEDGFAIPHSKTDGVSKPTIIFVRSDSPIKKYKTFDKTKVTKMIALLIPTESVNKVHIKILSAVAVKLTETSFRDSLASASSSKEIADIMKTIEIK